MKKVIYQVFLSSALLLLALPIGAQEYAEANYVIPKRGDTYISTKPQVLILGLNVGIDRVLSSKSMIGSDVTAHLWIVQRPSLAITPTYKYYFMGNSMDGSYLRAKLVAGVFLDKSNYDFGYGYAGGGFGIGATFPSKRSKKWHYFVDLGLKIVPILGEKPREDQFIERMDWIYLLNFSPSAFFDLSFGISYKL